MRLEKSSSDRLLLRSELVPFGGELTGTLLPTKPGRPRPDSLRRPHETRQDTHRTDNGSAGRNLGQIGQVFFIGDGLTGT